MARKDNRNNQFNSDNQSNNDEQSVNQTPNIEDIITSKEIRNEQGRALADKKTEEASKQVGETAGKAERAGLQQNAVNSLRLAHAEGTEEGIKAFLTEDIPQIFNALNAQIGEKYKLSIEKL